MKNILILILTFSPLISFGQHLKCCESIKEVETHLSGIWKLKDKDSDSQFFYKYTFENGQGHVTEMKKRDKKGKYLILDDHPFVDIIKYETGFKLKFTYLSGNSISELKYLNSNKMILITDGKQVEFTKESE
ncbi:MAG: hypothetical protein JXQ93_01970 [Flavobacteriaceae bacterium]